MEGRQGVEVLYLVRHGKAVASHPDGDRHRSLSSEGRLRIETMRPMAERQGFRAALSLSSPYLRALQTRDLFAEVLQPERNEISPVFTPEADPGEALVELRAWEAAGFRTMAVFTHNPFVSELADLLLVRGSVPSLVFHTPTILALGFEAGLAAGQGRPLWILHP